MLFVLMESHFLYLLKLRMLTECIIEICFLLGALFKKAELYLEYMKQIPIPTHRGSIIPFTSGGGGGGGWAVVGGTWQFN